MNIKVIFFNAEPRLRAGWRLLLQSTLLIIIAVASAIPLVILSLLFPDALDNWFLLIFQVTEFFAITGSVFLARRLIDRRSILSLGLKLNLWVFTYLLLGIAITFLIMALIYAIQWAAGWLTFDGFAWQFDPIPKVIGSTILGLLVYILVGWNEELISRGYHLQNLIDSTGIFWGLVISSTIFGLAHLGNPNATWLGAVGIILAGLFLAYGYLRTRQLWLSIGLHIGWNFFEGVIFGFPVSGMNSYQLTRITVTGPTIWTGGAFGPEAGLVLLPALILGTGLIYIFTRGRLGDEDNTQEGISIP